LVDGGNGGPIVGKLFGNVSVIGTPADGGARVRGWGGRGDLFGSLRRQFLGGGLVVVAELLVGGGSRGAGVVGRHRRRRGGGLAHESGVHVALRQLRRRGAAGRRLGLGAGSLKVPEGSCRHGRGGSDGEK